MRAETGASATRGSPRTAASDCRSLNEGRDRGLGNTYPAVDTHADHEARSMRAETGASATHGRGVSSVDRTGALNEGRDRGLGNTVSGRPWRTP